MTMHIHQKNFPGWCIEKQRIDEASTIPDGYKERDIWWMAIGHNVGFEEDGKGVQYSRPVLVVKGFSKHVFWGVPLSTSTKMGEYYHHFTVDNTISNALLSQLRTYDTKHMIEKYGMAPASDFEKIKAKLRSFLQ